MLNTLGEVVTCALVLAALAVVPYKLAKVWVWPHIRTLGGLFVMSRTPDEPPRTADMDAVSIPVSHTDMSAHTTPTDDYEMPRIGRELSDEELIAMLAVQRKNGKYRSSANKIAEYVGGDRNAVLAQIRAIREGPAGPVYPPYPPPTQLQAANGNET